MDEYGTLLAFQRRGRKTGYTILYIDDDPAHRRLIERTLEDREHNVVVMHSGEEALRYFATCKYKPQVVITDYDLGLLTGYDVAQLLKTGTDTQDIPIIGVTSGNSSRFWPQGQGRTTVDAIIEKMEFKDRIDSVLQELVKRAA